MNIYFLILSAFKYTGGLEKFNRAFIKALSEIAIEQNFDLKVESSHDSEPDQKYIVSERFEGFRGNKLKFALKCFTEARKMDLVFVGHINLSIAVIILKILNPKIRIVMIELFHKYIKMVTQLAQFIISCVFHPHRQIVLSC